MMECRHNPRVQTDAAGRIDNCDDGQGRASVGGPRSESAVPLTL
jgi:hypothetical protein